MHNITALELDGVAPRENESESVSDGKVTYNDGMHPKVYKL